MVICCCRSYWCTCVDSIDLMVPLHFDGREQSVSITPQIISTVMNALRVARIPFVVAPFEADAQVWLLVAMHNDLACCCWARDYVVGVVCRWCGFARRDWQQGL